VGHSAGGGFYIRHRHPLNNVGRSKRPRLMERSTEGRGRMAAQHAYPPGPVAPWAEVVPGASYPMTSDALRALPDDGWTYELVHGVLVRMPLSSGGASNVGYRLGSRLSVYVEDNNLGVVTGEQGGYRLDPAHPLATEVAPDVAFIRATRVTAICGERGAAVLPNRGWG